VAFTGTLLIHAAAGAFLLRFPSDPLRAAPPVYRVNLVAAPRPEPAARRAPEVVERPPAASTPAVPVAPRPAPRAPRPAPTTPPTTTPTQREPSPRATPQAEPLPGVTPSTGSDPATVEVEGLEFPYPEYLRNIVAQVYRRWERPGGNVALKAEVFFLVHRDGSVSNLRFVSRSGSFAFDLEAQGAIEAAAGAGAFGSLPQGFADDVLPVSFFFDPQKVR
jgi:outer membrane biosynthesis protein TonB